MDDDGAEDLAAADGAVATAPDEKPAAESIAEALVLEVQAKAIEVERLLAGLFDEIGTKIGNEDPLPISPPYFGEATDELAATLALSYVPEAYRFDVEQIALGYRSVLADRDGALHSVFHALLAIRSQLQTIGC